MLGRRKLTRRQFVAGMGMAAGLAMLGGCGGGARVGDGPRTVEEASGTVTLTGFSSSPAEEERLREMLADFEEANPEIQVDYQVTTGDYMQRLVTQLSSNTAADVFYLDSLFAPQLIATGALRPLDDYIEGSEVIDPADFYRPLVDAFTSLEDGMIYGMPKDYSILGLFYSLELFEQAGLDPDSPPATWDEVWEYGRKLTDGDGRWGLSLQPELPRYLAFALQQDAPIIDDERNVMPNLEGNLRALEFFAGMYTGPEKIAVQPADTGAQWAGDALGKGGIGMVFEGNWAIPFLNDTYPDREYRIAPLPYEGGQDSLLFTVAYCMNANAENPDAAWKLIEYLTGREGQRRWGELGLAIPPREDAVQSYLDQHPQARALVDSTPEATAWQLNTSDPQPVLDNSNNSIQRAFSSGPEQFRSILEEWKSTVESDVERADG
ncbi:ABC transporter substrate-binding protein [Rubrobacter taiwanensis]|uniref:ABC transporter substrate-binding protein n=1 Tax=Rubrobacter taiwanensis TaxID=185139 RepID=A0A4R1BLY4_9ACTN|nr:ABC transporter substrate-binding protein [Rubrobacter taiwanensis]TCJ18356.1 ABC transporter substrate-binding protein [Rubrobacter taiwanensis]